MLTSEEIAHQQALLKTYRDNLALYLRQQAMQGIAYVTPVVVLGIAEARENIARIKRILRENGVDVLDSANDDVPVDDRHAVAAPAQPTVSPAAPQVIDRTRLRQVLTDRFNDDELRDLTFELGIDYEDLPGTTRSGKARELITYTERRSRLAELVSAVRRLRPGAFG